MRLILLLLLSSSAFAFDSGIPKLYRENIPYQWFTESGAFYHQANFKFNPSIAKRYGFEYRLIYSMGMGSLDLQVGYAHSQWSAISTSISENVNDSSSQGATFDKLSDANSQIKFPRQVDDPWTETSAELGYSIRGRLVPMNEKYWMQQARFALGMINLTDTINSLSFKGYVIDTELTLFYQIAENMMIGPTVGMRSGWAYASDLEKSDLNRIPLFTFQCALSAVTRF